MYVHQCRLLVVFIVLLNNYPLLYAKEKIVKLIVPQKVKFIHHTHVLLVRPSHKKSKFRSEIIDDVGHRGSMSHLQYVLPYSPYYSQSKDVSYRYVTEPDEHEDEFLMDEYHSPSRRFPSVVRRPSSMKIRVREDGMDTRVEDKPSIIKSSDPETHLPYRKPPPVDHPPAQHSVPEQYHTLPWTDDYADHYNSGSGLSNDWNSISLSSSSQPDSYETMPKVEEDYNHLEESQMSYYPDDFSGNSQGKTYYTPTRSSETQGFRKPNEYIPYPPNEYGRFQLPVKQATPPPQHTNSYILYDNSKAIKPKVYEDYPPYSHNRARFKYYDHEKFRPGKWSSSGYHTD